MDGIYPSFFIIKRNYVNSYIFQKRLKIYYSIINLIIKNI